MTDRRLPPIHPGEILREEFMAPLRLTVDILAKELGVELSRLKSIVRGNAPIDADLAAHLGHRFGTSAALWMNLQRHYDECVHTDTEESERLSRKEQD